MSDTTSREKILVVRFSALGDVAMTVPVVKAFLEQHPEKELLMLSDKKLADLFVGIDRLEFFGADLQGEHKGLPGIIKLFNIIRKKYAFDLVADLHGVLRTHILRFLFKCIGKRTSVIDKGRIDKYALTRREHKIFRPLTHATERYIRVFSDLGFGLEGTKEYLKQVVFKKRPSDKSTLKSKLKIGFAPFAKHNTKMYSLDSFKEILRHFDDDSHELYLFGGKGAEERIINAWRKEFRNLVQPKGINGLKSELEIMKGLDLMLTMDSANMHLASLVDVPVISIWGATHSYAGFYGYNQNPLNAVQANLSCRPCSVFGNKPCWRGDHACMTAITPQMVIDKMEEALTKGK
jgi:ADP-heptose:LPS heptosyltransferase